MTPNEKESSDESEHANCSLHRSRLDTMQFPNPTRRELVIVRLLPMLLLALCYSSGVIAGDWSQEQIPKLPTGETPVQLFKFPIIRPAGGCDV